MGTKGWSKSEASVVLVSSKIDNLSTFNKSSCAEIKYLNLILLNLLIYTAFANSVDPDQLVSEEAN